MLRSHGLPNTTVSDLTRAAHTALHNVLRDPDGLWLLANHAASASELALTTWPEQSSAESAARPASIRVDRCFRAGPEPHAPGEDFLWIIDFKTSAHAPTGLDAFLTAQRATYGPQLEAYAHVLAPVRERSLEQVRLALYFPLIPRLTWWKPTFPTNR
jgi:hypothetical protein